MAIPVSVTESSSGAQNPPDSTASLPLAGGPLRRLMLRGSFLELTGFAGVYILRFVSGAILRDLLFPAAFGMMEVIGGICIGLGMLTDVGIQQAIIRSPRGDDPVFLNTAWTMRAVRGLLLWAMACLIAYPAALLADEPALAAYLPVAALSILVMGFGSTSELTLRRRMTLGPVVMIDVTCQVVTLIVAITWAYYDRSVWALVSGGIASATTRIILTHWLAARIGHRNRLAWDPGVRREIFTFGKWIAGSSAVYWLGSWGDRLLVVMLMGLATSGTYATAVLIAEALGGAIDRVVHGVFYPLFSQVGREGTERLRHVYYATRLRIDALTMTVSGALVVMAPWTIQLLFDDRYAEAGWMLSILAVRSALVNLASPCDTCITALGHSRIGFLQNLARSIWVLVLSPIGFWLNGTAGLVWASALSVLPALCILWRTFYKLGLLRIRRELLAVGFFCTGIGLGYLAVVVLPDAIWMRSLVKDFLLGGNG